MMATSTADAVFSLRYFSIMTKETKEKKQETKENYSVGKDVIKTTGYVNRQQ